MWEDGKLVTKESSGNTPQKAQQASPYDMNQYKKKIFDNLESFYDKADRQMKDIMADYNNYNKKVDSFTEKKNQILEKYETTYANMNDICQQASDRQKAYQNLFYKKIEYLDSKNDTIKKIQQSNRDW